MSSRNTPPSILETLRDLQRRVMLLERRKIRVPQYSSAPTNPREGEIWTQTDGKLYIRMGGTTRSYSPSA